MGKSFSQPLISPVPILIVGILRKNGLDENIQRISRTRSPGDAVMLFQKKSDLAQCCP